MELTSFLEKDIVWGYRHLLQFQQKFTWWANEGSVSWKRIYSRCLREMKHYTQFSFLHNFSSNKVFLKHFSDRKTCIYNVFSSDLYVCRNVMCNAYPVNNQNLVNKIFPSCNECQKLKGYDSVILSFISSRLSCYSDIQLIKIYQTRNRVFYPMCMEHS